MMNSGICIEIKNISFRYDGYPVLENVSFKINTGDYLGIIGPNGGGKTTLLKIMLGIIRPSSGHIKIFGNALKNFKERYLIGYVPQRVAQAEYYFPATVDEVVSSGRTARRGLLRKVTAEDHEAIEKAMETAGIIALRKKLIGRLSGGERQRAFIARALAGEPKILILDEPDVGVDIASKDKFYTFLTSLNKQHNITIIYVSHDVGTIAHEVNNIICLNSRLMCHGDPRDYIKEEFLEKVYGRKVSSVFHKH